MSQQEVAACPDVAEKTVAIDGPTEAVVEPQPLDGIVMVQVTDALGGVICSCVKSREEVYNGRCMHDSTAMASIGNPISRLWTRVFGA